MVFKECYRWMADNMPDTTPAVVIVSDCGTVVKRLSYVRWNHKNSSYAIMPEHIYKQSSNRGKQRYDSEERVKRHGLYKHVHINEKNRPVHRLVARAFIRNINDLPQVNHKDGNRSNNSFHNLEWVSGSDNMAHAVNELESHRYCRIPRDETSVMISKRMFGISTKRIANYYGVTHQSIDQRTMAVMTDKQKEISKRYTDKIGRLSKWSSGESGIRKLSDCFALMRAGKKIKTASSITELMAFKKEVAEREKNSIHSEVRELCKTNNIPIIDHAHEWESSH